MEGSGASTSRALAATRWGRSHWHYILVVVLACIATWSHVVAYTEMSPIDESRHLDYMIRATNGQLLRLGDVLSEEAMRIEACRGIDLANFESPPCHGRHQPAAFRDNGYNNAYGHPPLYYLTTGLVARPIEAVGLSSDLLGAARALGAVWLAVGLVLAMRAGELLGLSRVALAAAGTLVAGLPLVAFTSATVNSDVASIFAGGLVLWAAVQYERRRLALGWFVVVGGVAAGLKNTNLIAIAIIAAWLILRGIMSRQASGSPYWGSIKRSLIGAAGVIGGALVVTMAWGALVAVRATMNSIEIPSNAQFRYDSFPWEALLRPDMLFSMFPPTRTYLAPILQTDLVRSVLRLESAVVAAALLAPALTWRRRSPFSPLALSSVVVLITGAVGFVAITYLSDSVVFGLSARYALSSLAGVLVLLASLVRGTSGRWVIGVLASVVFLSTWITLVVG